MTAVEVMEYKKTVTEIAFEICQLEKFSKRNYADICKDIAIEIAGLRESAD